MNQTLKEISKTIASKKDELAVDWLNVSQLMLKSRALDDIEEKQLVPEKLVFNQFSARGHDFAQILLGSLLTHPHDAATGYYRSRPFVMSLGISLDEVVASPMAKEGGYSDGRDIGVVCNYPNTEKMAPCYSQCAAGLAHNIPLSLVGRNLFFTIETSWATTVMQVQLPYRWRGIPPCRPVVFGRH